MRRLGGLVLAFCLYAHPVFAQLTPAAGPASALGCDFRTAVCLHDDFLSGGYTSGIVGELGWTIVNGTATGIAAEANRYGILQRDTGSSINTATTMYPRGLASIGTINPAAIGTTVWHIKLGQSVGTFDFRAGLGNATTSDPPADGMYFEVLAADTNIFCVTRASSVSTGSRTNSGVAASTSWVTLKMVRTASSVQFYINGVLVATNTTNLTAVMLQPYFFLKNTEAVAKTVNIDMFDYTGSVTR